MVQPYSSTDTTTVWKKTHFIGEIRFPYDRQSVNSSPRFTSLYVDIPFSRWDIVPEVCVLVYNFQRLVISYRECSILFKTRLLCFICVHIEANPSRLPASGYTAKIYLGQLYLQEALDDLCSQHLPKFLLVGWLVGWLGFMAYQPL